MNQKSSKQVAVITGASSGIGYELARQFAQNGFDLLIASNSERIREAEESLRALGAEVRSVQADLATYEGVEQLCRAIQETGPAVNSVAINAGVGVGGEFARGTDLQAELELIHLNVISPVHLAKRVLKQM